MSSARHDDHDGPLTISVAAKLAATKSILWAACAHHGINVYRCNSNASPLLSHTRIASLHRFPSPYEGSPSTPWTPSEIRGGSVINDADTIDDGMSVPMHAILSPMQLSLARRDEVVNVWSWCLGLTPCIISLIPLVTVTRRRLLFVVSALVQACASLLAFRIRQHDADARRVVRYQLDRLVFSEATGTRLVAPWSGAGAHPDPCLPCRSLFDTRVLSGPAILLVITHRAPVDPSTDPVSVTAAIVQQLERDLHGSDGIWRLLIASPQGVPFSITSGAATALAGWNHLAVLGLASTGSAEAGAVGTLFDTGVSLLGPLAPLEKDQLESFARTAVPTPMQPATILVIQESIEVQVWNVVIASSVIDPTAAPPLVHVTCLHHHGQTPHGLETGLASSESTRWKA